MKSGNQFEIGSNCELAIVPSFLKSAIPTDSK
jgi:hypothetical protein